MNLSPHFTLAELTVTNSSLPNIPSDFEIIRLKRIAETLELVRSALGNKPIHINSGFRSEAVNRFVGGSVTSVHMLGYAADFTCPNFGRPMDICMAIIDAGIVFDQLILEPTWVHIGLGAITRHQVLTATGNSHYAPGLKEI